MCGLCACTSHYTDQCPQVQGDYTFAVANSYNCSPYQPQNQSNYSHDTNHLTRDNKQNQPPSSSTNQDDDSHCTFYQEQERLRAMIEKNEENTMNLNTKVGNMSAQMTSIVVMLSRGSINAITLRSGTTLEKVKPKPIILTEDVPNVGVEGTVELNEDEKEENAKKHEELDPNIMQMFKNVEVTIPLFDAIYQVSKFAKFLKDVCTHKEKTGGLEMNLLGSCVSIMPLSVYEKLNLAPLKRSGDRSVLADKSIISVVGVAENVLVRIQDLIFPVNFHILEAPPIDSDRPSSILLGRPFLKTSRFKLDAYSVEDDVAKIHFRSDDEISVIKGLGIREIDKEEENGPQPPCYQGNKALNHGLINKWKHIPLKDALAKGNKESNVDVLEDVPKR
ncbi:uncharacterized protein DS421_2g41140 [Arachis hypogaea]|nr:uncharacterized protein DS421_2g41140 [Arachis hypogaea]